MELNPRSRSPLLLGIGLDWLAKPYLKFQTSTISNFTVVALCAAPGMLALEADRATMQHLVLYPTQRHGIVGETQAGLWKELPLLGQQCVPRASVPVEDDANDIATCCSPLLFSLGELPTLTSQVMF